MVKQKPHGFPNSIMRAFLSKMSMYIIILLITIALIKISGEGFSNPQLLQREYYYFYPELFHSIPDSIPDSRESVEIDGSLEHDQNHWLPVTEEDFGLMGDSDMETPYLMEELYIVQDDIRDIKTKQEIIRQDLGIESSEAAEEPTCMSYSTGPGAPEPCPATTDITTCSAMEYCEYDTTLGNDGTPVGCHIQSDIDCSGDFEVNGGSVRSSCPWACEYQNGPDSTSVQGGYLLSAVNTL